MHALASAPHLALVHAAHALDVPSAHSLAQLALWQSTTGKKGPVALGHELVMQRCQQGPTAPVE